MKSRNNSYDGSTPLTTSNYVDDDNVLCIIVKLGMKRFAGGVMDVMQTVFGLDEKILPVTPDPEIGAMLLEGVMAGGDFGEYDKRYEKANGMWSHGWVNFKKRWRWFRVAP